MAPSVVAVLAVFAGGPVAVECHPFAPYQGWVVKNERTIHLSNSTCRWTNGVARTHHLPASIKGRGFYNDAPMYAAQALLTDMHEAAHIGNPEAEQWEVECYARRNVLRFARRLGVPSAERSRIAVLIRESRGTMPIEYQSPC